MKLIRFSAEARKRSSFFPLGPSCRKAIALSLCLPLLAVVGCREPTSGVISHCEYAYAAGKPDEVAKAKGRFESAVRFFQEAGLRTGAVHRSEQSSQAILAKAGTEARINLEFPDSGMAAITLVYRSEGSGSKAKTQAELMLARAQSLLAPEQTTPRAAN